LRCMSSSFGGVLSAAAADLVRTSKAGATSEPAKVPDCPEEGTPDLGWSRP